MVAGGRFAVSATTFPVLPESRTATKAIRHFVPDRRATTTKSVGGSPAAAVCTSARIVFGDASRGRSTRTACNGLCCRGFSQPHATRDATDRSCVSRVPASISRKPPASSVTIVVCRVVHRRRMTAPASTRFTVLEAVASPAGAVGSMPAGTASGSAVVPAAPADLSPPHAATTLPRTAIAAIVATTRPRPMGPASTRHLRALCPDRVSDRMEPRVPR